MLAIIIPAYNRPEKLRNALTSLVNQTNSRFFVCVVDDASTEDIKSVCDEFEPKLNIKYLRQPENKGPGAARQQGLLWATTLNMSMGGMMGIDLVMFLDSDDLLFPNAVQVLTHEINHTLSDIVVTNISVERTNEPQTTIKAEDSTTWLHGKIYRLSFLMDNLITFPEGLRMNEDVAFNLECLWSSEKVLSLDTSVCLWRDDKSSLTRDKDDTLKQRICADYIEAIWHAWNFFKDKKLPAKKLLGNICVCYNYYQESVSQTGSIRPEIEGYLRDMLNDKRIRVLLTKPKEMFRVKSLINQYSLNDKKIVMYQEAFGTWVNRYLTND